jgi:hypothetical protein
MNQRIQSVGWLVCLSACAVAPAEESAPVSSEGLLQELAAPEEACTQVAAGTDCGSDDRLYLCFANQPLGEGEACPRGCMDTGGDSDFCIEPEPCSGGAETCDGADNDCDGSIDEGLENACGGSCADQLEEVPGTFCMAECGGIGVSWAGAWECEGQSLRCVPCPHICMLADETAAHYPNPCAMPLNDVQTCVPVSTSCQAE